MKRTWVLAMAAGVAMSAAIPMEANAQGRSAQARRNQGQEQRQREEQSAQQLREQERERLRTERETEQRTAELRRRELELQRERDARLAEQRRREYELQREQQARLAEQRRRDAERARLREQRDDRYDDDRYYERRDDRYGYNDRFPEYGQHSRGPAFCRSGAGHPVHGRQWCVQKGFGLGWDRWERDRYDDVIFRDRYYRNQTMGRSVLGDILGSMLLNRFESYGRRFGSAPLTGYWLPNSSQRVLQLNVGNIPIARLIDFNRDGRVDDVFVIS